MSESFSIHRYESTISIIGNFAISDVRHALQVIDRLILDRSEKFLVLDFSQCAVAFSAAILPICAKCALLREQGVDAKLVLPEDPKLNRLFLNAGWAHLIEPQVFQAPDRRSGARQFPASQYKHQEEQNDLIDDLLERLLSVIPEFNRAAFAAVEWALNEISDNVINHSQSPVGGFLQLSVFDPRRSRVEFTIADAGIGIFKTLSTTLSDVRDDADALMASVRSGVTRNKQEFQGNGLYGTLEICRVGGGKFSLNSGRGYLHTSGQSLSAKNDRLEFCGTTVDAIIDFSEPMLLERALSIDGRVHKPVDYIELHYEQDGLTGIPIKLIGQSISFRSRPAGKPVKIKLQNIINACPGQVIFVDFSGITVISSSFADEVFGKLFLELGPMRFMQSLRLINVSPTVQALIDRAITQRMQLL